jgi:hypothetical protein
MTKYTWHQRYAFERFDLEGPNGKLVGWIVGTPDRSVTNFITRSSFGYVTSYSVEANSKEEISWTWKIWWAERDERGYYKDESLTDGKAYPKMDEAKASLQERFGIRPDEVTTVKWAGNLTEYN